MDKSERPMNGIKKAESEVFNNANQIIWDAQQMRTKPGEILPQFKTHTTALALAALELIAHHASPEEARAMLEEIASHYSNPVEQPAVAS